MFAGALLEPLKQELQDGDGVLEGKFSKVKCNKSWIDVRDGMSHPSKNHDSVSLFVLCSVQAVDKCTAKSGWADSDSANKCNQFNEAVILLYSKKERKGHTFLV